MTSPALACITVPLRRLGCGFIAGALLLAQFAPAADRGPELLAAAANGETAHVKKLLGLGVDVESRDNDGRTPLMLAAQHGHTETVRLLLSKGARTEVRDKSGMTAYGLTLLHKKHEAILKILPPPSPVRVAVDAAWSPADLISSCFMTRDQLIAQVEEMHLDALILSGFQGHMSASANGVLKIVRADRHGLAAPSRPEASADFDALLSIEVRPGAACGQTGDALNLAVDARVVRTQDQSIVLKDTFGGGLKGLSVRTAANPAQYLAYYDAWVNSHTGQVFQNSLAAILKIAPAVSAH